MDRLKGSVSEWEPGTVFELENGQRWKVLKGRVKLRKTLQAPEILVIPVTPNAGFCRPKRTCRVRVFIESTDVSMTRKRYRDALLH